MIFNVYSLLFHHCDKVSETILGRNYFAHDFRGFSSHGSLGPMHLGRADHHDSGAHEGSVHIMVDRKQKQGGPSSSDSLSPAKSHLLKFPEPSKIVPLAEDRALTA